MYIKNQNQIKEKKNTDYKIDIESINMNPNKNKIYSKYYNSEIINLYSEHDNVYMPLLPDFLKYEESQLKSRLDNYKKESTIITKIIILIPITLPGSGKTELIKYLQKNSNEYGIRFVYVSSDDIRKKEIEEYRKKIPGITEQEAFTKSRNYYNKSFQQEIETKFKNIMIKILIYILNLLK